MLIFEENRCCYVVQFAKLFYVELSVRVANVYWRVGIL